MSKKILLNEEARKAIKKGIDEVAETIRSTIGPRGRNVILEKGYGSPTITNDGVSIARDISLEDSFENMGSEMVKEVANKTNDTAGDGTTTSVILFQGLIEEGLKYTTLGTDVMGVRRGMEYAAESAIKILKEHSQKIEGKEKIKQVATVSAEEEKVGEIIADTIEKVGNDGVITVEESQSLGIHSDVVQGLELEKGYVSPYMVTNTERMEAVYKDVPIILTDKKITSIQEILPLLEKIAQGGTKDIVLIADGIEGEALTTFVINKLRGTFNVLAIEAPGFGDKKKELLKDIAVTVGGTVISDETGVKFETISLDELGRAGSIRATKDKTVIADGKGDAGKIKEHIQTLRAQEEATTSSYEKGTFSARIAKLSGGVAVVKVGAATETEMKYLKLKVEDAVNATKAAVEEGIVAGGGAALIHVSNALSGNHQELTQKKTLQHEELMGYKIVTQALRMPLRYIVENTGKTKDDGVAIALKVKEKGNPAGYDAQEGKLVDDMISAGIIDPVKVTRSALQNAVSAAAIFLTTEAAVSEIKKDTQEKGMPGGMGGMGGTMAPGMY